MSGGLTGLPKEVRAWKNPKGHHVDKSANVIIIQNKNFFSVEMDNVPVGQVSNIPEAKELEDWLDEFLEWIKVYEDASKRWKELH